MPIHYVDTYNGSDTNDGAAWSTAWKTCYPLTALYGGLGSVQDVEVRIAKTAPIETGRAIPGITSQNFSHAACFGVARPLAGYRKPVIPDYPNISTRVADYGGVVQAPFTSEPGMNPPYISAGPYKFRIRCPAATSGKAARWTLASGDFSTFDCFEVSGAFENVNNDLPSTAELWLDFSSDMAGNDVVWSRKVGIGDTRFSAKLALVGGGLPASAAYAWLRVSNQSAEEAWLHCSSIYAVLPVTHPNYVGLRLIYVPEDKMGMTLTPVTSSGETTYFNGVDGGAVDVFRSLNSLPPRTWSVYRWVPFPYQSIALLPSCAIAGRGTHPLKVIGGWNTVSDQIDGISAIDVANLRWFNEARSVSVDIRNLALAFGRTNSSRSGVPGVLEYAGYGNKRMPRCYAERVYMPAPGAGEIGSGRIGYYYGDFSKNSLIARQFTGGLADDRVAFRHCNFALTLPFVGDLTYETVEDTTWGMDGLFSRRPGVRAERCVAVSVRPITEDAVTNQPANGFFAPAFYDCDVVTTNVSNAFSNHFASAPLGYFDTCRLWGAHTGPVGARFPAKNLTFYPIPGFLGPVCTYGADIDGFICAHSDPAYGTSEGMFARLPPNGPPTTIRLRNAVVQSVFSSITPALGSYAGAVGHTVELENVVLHKTSASVGAPFNSTGLRATNLTLVGGWVALQGGVVYETHVETLALPDTARLVENFRFAGPSAGWGRVVASYRNIHHPLGLQWLLGSPGSGYLAAGAAWIHTSEGEMWASHVMSVRKDTTRTHSGVSSWRLTTLQPLGAISLGSFMLGVVPVIAGVPITLTARVFRDSRDVLGGIFIRPAATRQFAAPDVANAPTLHDIVTMSSPNENTMQWELLTVTYTPFRSGLVELHAGMRGLQASSVWLDSIEVVQ